MIFKKALERKGWALVESNNYGELWEKFVENFNYVHEVEIHTKRNDKIKPYIQIISYEKKVNSDTFNNAVSLSLSEVFIFTIRAFCNRKKLKNKAG